MPWILQRNEEGELDCLLNGRREFVIVKKASHVHPYLVFRIRHGRDGTEEFGGCDDFRTLQAAKEYVTENPKMWGG
jgi:hypothetical protein